MSSHFESLKFRVPIVVETDESVFHVYSPAFKSLHIEGASVEEALELGKENAKRHLESLIESGQPIPLDIVSFSDALDALADNKRYFVEEIVVELKCKRGP
jgi:predicted RNase H-like HicB family nuclease